MTRGDHEELDEEQWTSRTSRGMLVRERERVERRMLNHWPIELRHLSSDNIVTVLGTP